MNDPASINSPAGFQSAQARQFNEHVRRVLAGQGQNPAEIEAFMDNLPGPQSALIQRRGLDRLIGLGEIKERARTLIVTSKAKGGLFPSAILSGPPGIGRRSFAQAVGEELNCPFVAGERGITNRLGELGKLIRDAVGSTKRSSKPLLLFLDLSGASAGALDLVGRLISRSRLKARRRRGPLIPITVFVATSRIEALHPLFIKLFASRWHFGRHGVDDLRTIAKERFADKGLWSRFEATRLIAERSLGLAGRAVEIVDEVASFVAAQGDNTVFPDHAHQGCHLLGVDSVGLEDEHRRILMVLLEAGRKGCDEVSLARSVGMAPAFVEDEILPALQWLGFVRMSIGSCALSEAGHRHLAVEGLL